jgi:hypothetical protein
MEDIIRGLDANVGLALLEVSALLALSIVVAVFFAGLAGLARWAARPSKNKFNALWLMRQGIFGGGPFGIVGVTAGYMTASSRIGVIGALLPAALTLVGGIAVYLTAKGGKAAVFSAFAVINFSVMMLLGAEIGGRERLQSIQLQNTLEYQRSQIKQQFLTQRFCLSLGLDANCTPATVSDSDAGNGGPSQP